MDFTYNEKTVMSSGGFIPSTNDTPLDARGRVNLYSEIKDIPNPYVGMEIRVLQDETNEGKMTKYKVTKLLPNEFGVPNSYIDTDTLEKISESLSDEDLVFDGICEDELEVITPQLKTDYNLTTTDKTIVGAINELKEALANIIIGDNGEAVNPPFNSIDKGLASSNIDFSEIKNGNYCYIIRGTIGYNVPDGNLPLNNDMVHITKSNTAMTIITLSGGIYTYNGGTNGTDYISCIKDNFMTYSVASETYQLKNDSKLITTDKTVVGAINELKNALDSGVNGVSTILTVSPTYEELDTLPEGSKVYILNGLGYNGDPVHINKSSDTITLIGIDGAINKYQKVGSSWSNYSTENWATQKYVDTAIANAQLGGESGSVDLSEYQKITDSSLTTTNKTIVGAINEIKKEINNGGSGGIFETDQLTINSAGGIKTNTDLNGMSWQEIIEAMFYPYTQPVISVTGTPNGGVYEKGNTQTITNVKVVVTKKSKKITKVEVFNGATSLGSKTGTEVENGGTFNFAVSVPVNSINVQLTAKATDETGDSGVSSATTGAFTFVYPYYVGICDDGVAIDETLVKSLTKKIENKANKSISYTTNNQRMVFAYPKSYGAIKSIIDPNNFDVTATFTSTTVSVTGLDGTAQDYYVYVNGASTQSNFTMKFNY